MRSGRRGEEAGAKTSAVRCDMCDEQWRGEEEGQLWSREIAELEGSNGERGVGGWEQGGGRLVVFSAPTMWGRGSVIISDTADNRSASPYHYLFVLLGCLLPAETPPPIPLWLCQLGAPHVLLNIHLSPLCHRYLLSPPLLHCIHSFTSPPFHPHFPALRSLVPFFFFFFLSWASPCPGFTLCLLSSSISTVCLPLCPPPQSLTPLYPPFCMSQLAGCVGLCGPGAAEHG